MLRVDGHVAPDGARDVDLLVPRAAAPWIEEHLGDRLAAAVAEAEARRAAEAAAGGGEAGSAGQEAAGPPLAAGPDAAGPR
jgi:hypothetical protein